MAKLALARNSFNHRSFSTSSFFDVVSSAKASIESWAKRTTAMSIPRSTNREVR